MLKKISLGLVLLLPACAADSTEPVEGGRQVVHLTGSDQCDDPVEICNYSYPPQCHEYCEEDTEPGDSDSCVVDSDGNVSCDGEPCVDLLNDDGDEIISCPGDGCVVSISDGGTEMISCPSGDPECPNPDPDGGCSVPGGPPGA